MIHTMSQLYEFRLIPVPTFIPQKMKNFSVLHFRYRDFISSGEKLYVMTKLNDDFDTLEVDFDEMRWANSERTIAEYKLFVSDLKCDAAIRPNPWAHPWTQYGRINHADDGNQSKEKGICLTAYIWYFPDDCLIDNNAGLFSCFILRLL
ncbi:putative F-box protein [Helianthus annuus]|nr:putative F-box protein [Helianthus annuus]